MSTTGAKQVFKVTGEMQIDVEGTQDKAGAGTVKFVGTPVNTLQTYAEMRMYGFGGNGFLVMDTTGLNQGFRVRTSKEQGGSEVGGDGQAYAFQVGDGTSKLLTTCRALKVAGDSNTTSMGITRTSSSTTSFYNPMMTASQTTIKPTEIISNEIGFSSRKPFWGMQTPFGNEYDGNNFGVLGYYASTPKVALKWTESGDVEIPNKLTVSGTVTAGAVSVNGTYVYSGTGDPEGVVTAPVGSLFLRTNGGVGTTLYTKEAGTGTAGWAPVLTSTSGAPSWTKITNTSVYYPYLSADTTFTLLEFPAGTLLTGVTYELSASIRVNPNTSWNWQTMVCWFSFGLDATASSKSFQGILEGNVQGQTVNLPIAQATIIGDATKATRLRMLTNGYVSGQIIYFFAGSINFFYRRVD